MFNKNLTLLFLSSALAFCGDPGQLRVRLVVPDQASYSGVRQVSERATFFDHERFRVTVQPNQSGYVYVFTRNDEGEVKLLYPLRGDGDGYVSRNQRVNLPGDGWLRFDSTAEQEELILIESADPLVDLEHAGRHGQPIDSELFAGFERHPDRDMRVRHLFLEHENR
jgi:hypothetical protein